MHVFLSKAINVPKNILLERPTKPITTALWNLQDNLSITDISNGHFTVGFIVLTGFQLGSGLPAAVREMSPREVQTINQNYCYTTQVMRDRKSTGIVIVGSVRLACF